MVEQERRTPTICIHPLLWREIERCEGFIGDLLREENESPPFSVYVCAPLQPTTRKSAFQHIAECVFAASSIEGARYEGRRVVTYIPHAEILPIFNEIVAPPQRILAMAVSLYCVIYHDAVVTVGKRRSSGMQIEITQAEKLGSPVMSLAAFRQRLTNLPSQVQVQKTFATIIQSLPPGLFTSELFKTK